MKYIRDRKKRWILAVLLGMLLSVLAAGAENNPGQGVPAFFGMLYPQFCFCEKPEDGQGEIPMERKLVFRWLRGL